MNPFYFARQKPDHAAIIMAETGESVTYRQLDERSNQYARMFRAHGLGIGDVIGVMMENNARYLEIYWAALRSGLYFTAISTKLTASEVAYILGDCGAKMFITSHTLAGVAGAVDHLIPADIRRLMLKANHGAYQDLQAIAGAYPATPIPDETAGTDMLYSSGTTGRPKGIKRPLSGKPIDHIPEMSVILQKIYHYDDQTIYLSTAPLYHSAPLRFCMRIHAYGGTIVVMESFDPELALALIEKHKITHSQWVPTMFSRLLKLPDATRHRYDLATHKVAVHGAAPCPMPVKRQMIDWWGPILVEYYGGTEGNGYCAINAQEWLGHPGSVGRAYIGKVRIVEDGGHEAKTGDEGIVYFSDAPKFEYHNDPAKTAEAFNAKGWSTLGDVGRVDDEGYLYLTDRKAFMIISGGVNIYPQEAESVLITHPKVADVAVIGVPNEEFGEEVKAVVQLVDMTLAGPATAQELIAFCRTQLSAVKCPRSINFDAELPRHPTGKLYKRLIRDRYWAGRTSRIV